MRILRILFIFIFVLVGLYLLASLFIPAKFKVERSENFNAPVDLVFEQISTFKKWEKWNPWKKQDSEVKSLFGPNQGKVGSYWLWKGDKVGEGRMTLMSITDQKEIRYLYEFNKPYQAEAEGYIKLEANGNQTTATWYIEGSNPFYLRVLNLIMDRQIGPNFETGLSALKRNSEKEYRVLKEEYFGYRIKQSTFSARKVGMVRKAILIPELDDFFAKNYEKVKREALDCGFKIRGKALGLYYRWDYVNGVATVAAALPLEGDSTLGHDVSLIKLGPQKALLLNYYGGYKSNQDAYKALDNYIRNKNLIRKSPVIEEYIIGPAQVADSSKWYTKIWYLL